ncbi:MAG: glycosyl hydrolase [Thalassotalea sp.]
MKRLINTLLSPFILFASIASADTLEKTFVQPPNIFKSQPLLHLNGTLNKKDIEAQLKSANHESGFGGVAPVPMTPTKPKYLTDDYFEQYGHILNTSKSLGMNVIFYDDINFPSGSAGGKMKEKFPNDTMTRLDMLQEEVTGPTKWERALPKGTHMGAVAMNVKTFERLELHPSNNTVSWNVPVGSWKLMIFTGLRDVPGGKNADKVDYLNPESVDKFLSITYDEYYKRFSSHFGSTIKMTFFDDITMRYPEHRVWTPVFNDKFKAKYGYSPVSLYPALWESIGPETDAARVALFSFRSELMSDGYPRKIQEWAAKHGVQSSGHAMGQYHPQSTFMAGDAMKFYEHSDIPMMDSIHYYSHGREGFKLTSSASYNYDKALTSVEIYGNFRASDEGKVPFNTDMLYRAGTEMFAFGANVFIPHGMWYVPERIGIQPLISNFNPEIAADLNDYNQWVGRSSVLLREGRHVADIAVLYPIASMYAHAELDAPVGRKERKIHPGLFIPDETDMNELSTSLSSGVRRDFTYLHPEVFDDRCSIEGDTLKLNNEVNYEQYKILIMPGGKVIYWSNLQKIKAFYDAGGTIIATSKLPVKSAEFGHDEDVQNTIKEIFGVDSTLANAQENIKRTNTAGGNAYFAPGFKKDRSVLAKILEKAHPEPDVRFVDVAPTINTKKGMLLYLHKVKEGRNIYYFSNSTAQLIDASVELRGPQKLQLWDPHTGTTHKVESKIVDNYTVAQIKLASLKSLFLVQDITDLGHRQK